MNANIYDILGMIAPAAPLLAILVILIHYHLRRAAWKRRRRMGLPNRGFCPSTSGLGTAFQHLQVFHRPSMAYVVQVKREEDEDRDDEGYPESPLKLFKRQLRRIRNGEKIEMLVLRL
jgi:hypothetical protein